METRLFLTVFKILASALVFASSVSSFSAAFRLVGQRQSCFNTVLQANNSKKNLPIEIPPNEFSRTLQPDRILKTKRGGSGYALTIAADETERKALALRFDLSEIAILSADLQLRPNLIGAKLAGGSGVEVEGTCKATVTQRCVRTNEDFQVDLEFPLYCIVRPVLPMSQLSSQYEDEQDDSPRRKQGPTTRKSSYRPQGRNIDEMDVMELQRMFQFDISDDDDVLMEDEAIYCIDGLMDVGELVSQLFWLKLDPYPKKPGTDPVQRSITG